MNPKQVRKFRFYVECVPRMELSRMRFVEAMFLTAACHVRENLLQSSFLVGIHVADYRIA